MFRRRLKSTAAIAFGFYGALSVSAALAITVDNIVVQTPQNTVAAPVGNVGELVTSTVLVGSAVTLTTTATPYNLTSVVLTQGQWRCQANVIATAAGTTFPSLIVAFDATTATLPTAPAGGYAQSIVSAGTGIGGVVSGAADFQISANAATEFAVVQGAFTGTAPTVYGSVTCLRIR